MRVDKFICASTGLSRTQAKKIISQGEIRVDVDESQASRANLGISDIALAILIETCYMRQK